MREYDVELAVGDAVCLGDRILTILDIQGDEISYRIDDAQHLFAETVEFCVDSVRPPR